MSGGGVAEMGSIPMSTRKMIQSLKEIVNCPDQEIYAALKECGMDPDETVSRLLHQDTFQEVKNKRDKKKEVKDSLESRSRGVNNVSSRGGRLSTDRDYGVNRSKVLPKKETASNMIHSVSILGPGSSGNVINRAATFSSVPCADASNQMVSVAEDASSPLNHSTGFHHAWPGASGQISLAEIVKRGKPPGKPSSSSVAATEMPTSFHNPNAISTSHLNEQSSVFTIPSSSVQKLPSQGCEAVEPNSGIISEHSVEQPIGQLHVDSSTSTSFFDSSASPRTHDDDVNQHFESQVDAIHSLDVTATVSEKHLHITPSGGGSSVDDISSKNSNSFQSQWHTVEHPEAESADAEMSPFDDSFQQLSLNKDDFEGVPADAKPALIIPQHLQVTNVDCSLLSFGSFRSGESTSFGSSILSTAAKSDLESTSVIVDVPSVDDSPDRNPEYYAGGHLKSSSELNVEISPRVGTMSGDHNIPSSSQSAIVGADSSSPRHGHQYIIQPPLGAYDFQEPIARRPNLAPLANITEVYADSSLASGGQSGRDLDLSYSSLLAPHSMPAKYGSATSSISGSTISITETAKPDMFSILQQTSHALAGSNIPSGHTLPQHLAVHPYPQPTLPLGPFANMISYPFLPSNYAYLASAAFQQAYPGGTGYHQSPATLQNAGMKYPPQYKSAATVNSLPQSVAVPSSYGGFGNSANIPGNFMLNPPSAPASTGGYDDNLRAQYKEATHFASPQQSENSPMWIQSGGSRTISVPQASPYYNLPGQSQLSALRQTQHQPSQYGNLGYPSYYYSKSDASQEHQQSRVDGGLNLSQGLPSQSSHQLWQNNY